MLRTHPEQAAKITGILLDMSSEELRHLLADEDALYRTINEAGQVLLLNVPEAVDLDEQKGKIKQGPAPAGAAADSAADATAAADAAAAAEC